MREPPRARRIMFQLLFFSYFFCLVFYFLRNAVIGYRFRSARWMQRISRAFALARALLLEGGNEDVSCPGFEPHGTLSLATKRQSANRDSKQTGDGKNYYGGCNSRSRLGAQLGETFTRSDPRGDRSGAANTPVERAAVICRKLEERIADQGAPPRGLRLSESHGSFAG